MKLIQLYTDLEKDELDEFFENFEIHYEPLKEMGECFNCAEKTYFQDKGTNTPLCSTECVKAFDEFIKMHAEAWNIPY